METSHLCGVHLTVKREGVLHENGEFTVAAPPTKSPIVAGGLSHSRIDLRSSTSKSPTPRNPLITQPIPPGLPFGVAARLLPPNPLLLNQPIRELPMNALVQPRTFLLFSHPQPNRLLQNNPNQKRPHRRERRRRK